MRVTIYTGLLSIILGLCSTLEAKPRTSKPSSPTRVAIGHFDGDAGSELEAIVGSALAKTKGVEIVSAQDWRSTADRLGLDPRSADSIVRVATELKVAALLNGSLGGAGKSWTGSVVVMSAETGASVGSYKIKQKSKAKALANVKKRMAKKLGGVIRAQKAPVAAAPVAEPTAPAEVPAEVPAEAPAAPSAPLGPKKRVVVLDLEGDRAGELRDFLEKELASGLHIEIVPNADAQRIVKELSLDLEDEEDRARIAARLDLSAFIGGEIERDDRELQISYEVYGGSDGEALGSGESSSNRVSSLARVLRRDLEPLLEKAHAPGAPTASSEAPAPRNEASSGEAAAARSETKREDSSRAKSGVPSERALELALGFQWGLRDFGYKDDVFSQLRAYEHLGVTALSARLLWYPGAHFTSGLAANIGLDAQFDLGIGLGTETADGASTFGTSAMNLAASLRGRLPLGPHELGLFAGIAVDRFALEGAETLFPNASYLSLRPGLAGRFWLGDALSLSPHFAWRVVLDAGDVTGADWFPRASVGGLDAGLVVGLRIVGPLEAQLAVAYRRYFFSMNPEMGDARVAGGALDQRFTGTLYIALFLD